MSLLRPDIIATLPDGDRLRLSERDLKHRVADVYRDRGSAEEGTPAGFGTRGTLTHEVDAIQALVAERLPNRTDCEHRELAARLHAALVGQTGRLSPEQRRVYGLPESIEHNSYQVSRG